MFEVLFIGGFGPVELFVILALLVLLFGAQKLPELARSSGQAVGEFQKGRMEIEEEIRRSARRVADPDTDAEETVSADVDDELLSGTAGSA